MTQQAAEKSLRAAALALLVAATMALVPIALPVVGAADRGVEGGLVEGERVLAGADRYATAVALAEAALAATGLAEVGTGGAAIVVSGESLVDALSAVSLAAAKSSVVLLTQSSTLPDVLREFIDVRGFTSITIVGGPAAVSPAVEAQLGRLASVETVSRVQGPDRYATSAQVAAAGTPGRWCGDGEPAAVVVSGESLIDGVLAAPVAYAMGLPVLYTRPDALPAEVVAYLADGGVERAVIVGSDAQVSAAVTTQLAAASVAVTRIGGVDAPARSVALVTALNDCGDAFKVADDGYALVDVNVSVDGVTAAAALASGLGASGRADQLVPALGVADTLPHTVRRYLSTVEPAEAQQVTLWALGGIARITPALMSEAIAAVTSEPAAPLLAEPPARLAVDRDCEDIECVFRLAAEQRARIVADLTDKIERGSYGVGADDVLRGPGGFEVDLRACGPNWNNQGGITGEQVRIGVSTPQTGELASYGRMATGWANYLDWVNANDPITVDGSPRALTLVVKDDAYTARKAQDTVGELLASDNVFAVHTLGAVSTLATYDAINRACVPHPYVFSTHPAVGDPVKHPWTTGLSLSYSTEVILWLQWMARNLSEQLPVKVAGLVVDDDFGEIYAKSFAALARMNPNVVSEFVRVPHDPTAVSITDEMSIVKAVDPDVFITMTAGEFCLLATQEADANGLSDALDAAFVSLPCDGVFTDLSPTSDVGDGWCTVGSAVKHHTDPNFRNEPFMAFLNDNFATAGLDSSSTFHGIGYFTSYPYVESLRIAAALPGGVTRSNFILAVRAVDLYHPMLIDGIVFQMDGNDDAFPIEGADFQQHDAATRRWTWDPAHTIDRNRRTPTCS